MPLRRVRRYMKGTVSGGRCPRPRPTLRRLDGIGTRERRVVVKGPRGTDAAERPVPTASRYRGASLVVSQDPPRRNVIQWSASTTSPDSVAEHLGQPLPDTLLLISASHSWRGFTRQSHQTRSPLPGRTISGVRAPFFLLYQTWRGFTGQRHQTLLLLPALTASGVRWPFFSVCHS